MSTATALSGSSSAAAAASETSLEDLAQQLIDQKNSKLVIAVAGGGGHAISSLAATPGASVVLYEGTVTYDRNSFRNYVAKSQQHIASATKAMTSLEFKFASLEAAQLLSEVSLQRALTYAAVQDANILTYTSNQHIGIGCASALVSNKHKRMINNHNNYNNREVDNSNHSQTTSNDNNHVNSNNHNNTATGYIYARKGKSRAFVVATRADGRQWYGNLTLVEGRSRLEEDLMVSHFLLQAAHQVNRDDSMEDESSSRGTTLLPNMLPGDEIQNWFQSACQPSITTDTSTTTTTTIPDAETNPEEEDAVITAAQRIVQGEAQVILLVPTKTSKSASSSSSSGYTYRAVQYPVLPHASLIFPGSYNPPHVGHAELAKAALQEVMGEYSDSTNVPAVFMEMSLTNPDKPSMDPLVVSQRAHQFFHLMEHMPQNWGLLLTRAPLFAQKVELLQSLIAPASPEHNATIANKYSKSKNIPTNGNSGDGDDDDKDTDHHLFFILGTDTMIRILNPKYYGNNFEAMVRAVRGMKKHHVHFIAGGRLDQNTPTSENFVTGEAELEGLPPDIQDMFTLLREFRIDISSSAIRQRKLSQQQEQPSQNPTAQPVEGT